MRVWITCDSDWALCLWREKPTLQDDGVWMNDSEEYCVLDNDICFYLTDIDLEKRGIVEIDINLVPPSVQQLESNKHIKARKHK
jgi:hypothetical protein|nr:MAG TPA: hypothetical protein [Bacteriophage sp.]